MSKVDMKSLYVVAKEATTNQEEKARKKQERVQACIKQFNDKCDTLHEKYFDENLCWVNYHKEF